MSQTHLLYPNGMLANNNGSDYPFCQPPYNTNFGAPPPAPAAVNGYPGYNYGPPPPVPNYNSGYPGYNYGPQPAHTPYQLHGYPNNCYAPQPQPQPQPPSNYGYYPAPQPVARRPKPKNGRTGRKPSSSEAYTISGNRISGNTGDHHGIFNIGNKHSRRDIDNDEEEEEEHEEN